MLHNCCGSLLVCFKFFSLFKDRCLPNLSMFWGILCRDIFHFAEFVGMNSRVVILLLFFPYHAFFSFGFWSMCGLVVYAITWSLWCPKGTNMIYMCKRKLLMETNDFPVMFQYICTPFMSSVLCSFWTLTLPKV